MIFDVLTQTILHIQNIDMLTYQRAKCSLTFYQPYSFTHDQFQTIVVWLSCKSGVLHMYILFKEIRGLSEKFVDTLSTTEQEQLTSFIMYIIIFSNISGINMRKIMVIR